MTSNLSRILLALLLTSVFISETFGAGVNVFLYHRFDEPRYASTNIAGEVFARQLAYLQENNYRVLSLQEVVRRVRTGEPFPEKSVAISIDDSFISFQEKAMPLLRKYQYPVTMFVNSDSVGTGDYLSWKDLKALVLEGVEIGNHSATHDYLVDLKNGETRKQWRERVRADIEKAQLAFEEHLEVSPTLFAYPYGEYNLELMQIVKDSGFEAGFAQQSGIIHGSSSLMDLPRFPMGGPFATLDGFKSKVRMAPLLIVEEKPVEPVLAEENPPVLLVRIDSPKADLRRINCFVQGDNSCKARPVAEEPGWFEVRAEKPLTGRRNKYTLTTQSRDGAVWHWYSHLWIKSEDAVSGGGKE